MSRVAQAIQKPPANAASSGGRPGRIQKTIDVPSARPRGEEVKSEKAFIDMRREIWDILKAGIHV